MFTNLGDEGEGNHVTVRAWEAKLVLAVEDLSRLEVDQLVEAKEAEVRITAGLESSSQYCTIDSRMPLALERYASLCP